MAGEGDPAGASEAFQAGGGHAREGRWAEAVEAFQRALSLRPAWFAAEANLGVALRALGRFDDALAAYDRALALQPGDPALLKNRGNAVADQAVRLRREERSAEALACLDAGIAVSPDDSTLQRHRANLLFDLGRLAEALAQLNVVIAMAPNADSFIRRGLILQRLGRHAEGLSAFAEAWALEPTNADAAFFESMSLLALGRYRRGWQAFERRWDAGSLAGLAEGQVTPRLRERLTLAPTRDDLAGRRLLVAGEQGVGDVLMFASCLPDLLTDAAEVSLVVEPRLRRLFAASFDKLRLVEAPNPSEFDRVVAIGSLCGVYRNDQRDFRGEPYLKPSEAARQAAAARLGPRTRRLRIGLSWRGGTKLTATDQRSIPLARLAPLLAIPDVEFVSLQYGDQSEAAGMANLRVLDPIPDFDDLAATVLEMDLIVSIQTTLIHLAGALGAATRVMVPHVAEWRYGASGGAMPWYGSVRLIRQEAEGAWGPVIDQIAEEIRARA